MSKSDNEHTPRLDRTSTIRIINDHPLALTLVSATAKRGAWSVGKPPVTVIEPGTDSGDMILLDKFGIHGSEGSLEYRLGSGEETIKIIFSCPLMGKNTAQWGLPELAGVQLDRPTFESAGPLSAEFTVSHPDTGT